MITPDIEKAKGLIQTVMTDSGAESFGEHRGWELWHIDTLVQMSKQSDKPVSVEFGRRHCFIAINYHTQQRLEAFGPGQAESFKSILTRINTQR